MESVAGLVWNQRPNSRGMRIGSTKPIPPRCWSCPSCGNWPQSSSAGAAIAGKPRVLLADGCLHPARASPAMWWTCSTSMARSVERELLLPRSLTKRHGFGPRQAGLYSVPCPEQGCRAYLAGQVRRTSAVSADFPWVAAGLPSAPPSRSRPKSSVRLLIQPPRSSAIHLCVTPLSSPDPPESSRLSPHQFPRRPRATSIPASFGRYGYSANRSLGRRQTAL